jgi:hypothetical protein
MNIYTLHKEGSFRPPTLECDSEIENSQSEREKLPRPALGVVTEEKNNTSTSDTSGTSGSDHSSSLGEKTTPRHNVTPTHNVQNKYENDVANNLANNLANNVANTSRVAASRIDATGLITGTNMPQLLSSKAALNNEATSKPMTMRQVNYGSSQLRKGRRTNGLIHIQARDEFMIFEDNTDLVSHITTPSAVRTSPLDGDYLVIDHDEFAEEEDLFSAITVPKALRKKKKKPKTGSPSQKENNINEVQKSENDEKLSKDTVQEEPKLAPPPTPFSVPYDESEELKQEERQKTPSPEISPLKLRRQDSLDCSPNVSQNSGSSRRSSLRGGRRIDQSGKVSTPPRIGEEKRQEEESPNSKALGVEDLVEVKKKLNNQQEQFPISPPSIKRTSPAASPASQAGASSKASPSIKGETNCITPEKSQPSPKEEMAFIDESHKSPVVRDCIKTPTSSTPTPRRNNSRGVGGGVSVNAVRDTVAPEAATHGIDAVAKTNRDSTAITEKEGSNEGSTSNNLSNEVLDKSLKVPNSRRKGTANLLKFCLLTSHCCPQRRRKKESEEPQMR